MHESESRSVVSNSLRPHGLYSPWNSPGQNTGVGSLPLLQGIFPTQGSNLGLLHCRRILYQLSHQGSPNRNKMPNKIMHLNLKTVPHQSREKLSSMKPVPGAKRLGNHCSCLRESESESHSVVSNSLRPHGLYSPWNSPGQNTGVGSRSLLQGIFPTQGSNPGLPYCRWILSAESQGKPKNTGEII